MKYIVLYSLIGILLIGGAIYFSIASSPKPLISDTNHSDHIGCWNVTTQDYSACK